MDTFPKNVENTIKIFNNLHDSLPLPIVKMISKHPIESLMIKILPNNDISFIKEKKLKEIIYAKKFYFLYDTSYYGEIYVECDKFKETLKPINITFSYNVLTKEYGIF